MPCDRCCEKDKNGDWIESPCCNDTGVCTAAFTTQSISLCICCGAEMFEENGIWFNHIQKDIPFKERGTKHMIEFEKK